MEKWRHKKKSSKSNSDEILCASHRNHQERSSKSMTLQNLETRKIDSGNSSDENQKKRKAKKSHSTNYPEKNGQQLFEEALSLATKPKKLKKLIEKADASVSKNMNISNFSSFSYKRMIKGKPFCIT